MLKLEQWPVITAEQLSAHCHPQMCMLGGGGRGSDALLLYALLTLCCIMLTGDDRHIHKLNTRQFCSNQLLNCSVPLRNILLFSSEMWRKDCVAWCHSLCAIKAGHRPSFMKVRHKVSANRNEGKRRGTKENERGEVVSEREQSRQGGWGRECQAGGIGKEKTCGMLEECEKK